MFLGRKRVAVLVPFLAVVGLAVWLGWAQWGPDTTEGTQPRLRYGDVSVVQPSEESGLRAFARYAPPQSADKPGGGPLSLSEV